MLAYVVTLPADTQLAIAGLVGLVVMLVINLIGSHIPWAVPVLMKYKDEVSAVLSGALIGWLSNVLPGGAFENVSIIGINLVVALIAAWLAYGALQFARNVKAKYALK